MPGTTEPKRDEEAVRAFAENFSFMLAERGVPRMAGRVTAALMTAEDDSMTAADLADALRVSPAAVSGALKYLVHVGLFVRESIPHTRRDRYRFSDDNWYSAAILKTDFMNRAADEAEKMIVAVGGPDTVAGRRLDDMADFYRFVAGQLPELYEQWQEHKRHRQTPPPTL